MQRSLQQFVCRTLSRVATLLQSEKGDRSYGDFAPTSLLGNNLIVSLHKAHKRGRAFSAKQEEQQCALNVGEEWELHGSDFSPITVEFSTIVPSGDFPPGRARCLMKELPRRNVENHRETSSRERWEKKFPWTEREGRWG